MAINTELPISKVLVDDQEISLASSGGGGEEVTTGKYVCKVIDYDGTIVKEEYHDAGDTFTLPSLPTHDGLIAQGYSSPVDIVDNQVTVENSDLIIGVMYTTTSGLSEFDIELNKVTGLNVMLQMDGTKDWGDGTSNTETTHTYASYGKYTIKCDGTKINSFGLLNQVMDDTTNYYYKEIRFGQGITTISGYSLAHSYSLNAVVIPNGVTSIDGQSFNNCRSLKAVVIPNSVTNLGNGAFSYCYRLTNVAIPNSITSTGGETFRENTSLINVLIPNGLLTIGSYKFYMCRSLTKISIPNTVTNISANAFLACWNMLEYDFSKHSLVPTLANTSAFTGINGQAKIIVPDNLYDQWIAATNWSTYANYIYKASEVTE